MVKGASIPDEDIVDFYRIPSRQKMRRSVGAKTNIITESESENSGGSREIITPGADLLMISILLLIEIIFI